ncbi:MAG: hypothetical protein REJ24_02365 [Rhodocyclaceae bacterium]|nr:hypothetical protein [Pseudomonadota bacterium]MDQ7971379.1 hypothetical protein [Rhodocyclaceae bacterium]MDQ8002054.1 hypothetical protein [Pseudomonadota bacterium]
MTSMRLPALLTIAYLNGIGLFLAHDAATAPARHAAQAGAHSCRAPQAIAAPPAHAGSSAA